MAIWNQTTSESNNDKPSAPPINAPVPQVNAPAVQATAIPVVKEGAARGSRESVFGAGVTIEGKIEGDADVRIAGKFKGDIMIKGDLHVDKGARLAAKISALNVTLGGELDGNVIATGQVRLMESAQMLGDLKANTLTVAAGSRMRGHVEFGWNPAEAAKSAGHAQDKDKSAGHAHDKEKNGVA